MNRPGLLTLLIFVCGLFHSSQSLGENKRATYFNAQRSIFGIVDYFKRNEAVIRNPDAVVLIDQVQEIYDVDFSYSFSPESDFMMGFNSAFRRLHDDSFRVDKSVFESVANGHSFNANSIRSLYCDQFPLPQGFLEVLSSQINKGGYYATHAGFQLQIAINNGCLNPSDPEVQALTQKLIESLRMVASTDTTNVDVCIEAMAVLIYLGRSDLLEKEWIAYIISTQNTDGGFPPTTQDVESHPHTAGLALWVLLETAFNAGVSDMLDDAGLDPEAVIVEALSEELNPVLLAANWYVGKEFQVHWKTNFIEAVFSAKPELKNANTFLHMYVGVFAPAYQISKDELVQFSTRSPILNKSLLSMIGLYCNSLPERNTMIDPLLKKASLSHDDWLMDYLLFRGFIQENGCTDALENEYLEMIESTLCKPAVKKTSNGMGFEFESAALQWYACDSYQPTVTMVEAAKNKLAVLEQGLSDGDDDRVPIYCFWVSKLSDKRKKRSEWIGY